MKKNLELSIQYIESIPIKQKKDVIEDNSASLASSKIIMEKDTKGLKIPYIIGTEMFNAEKAIRLDVAPEEKEKEDNDDNDKKEVLEVIYIYPKQQAKWDRIRIKKEEEKK